MDRLIEARRGLPDIFEPDLYSGRLNQMASINMVLAGGGSNGMDELLNSDSPAGRYARSRGMTRIRPVAGSESDSDMEETQFPVIPDAMYSPSEEKYPFLQSEIGLKGSTSKQASSRSVSAATAVSSKFAMRSRMRKVSSSASSVTTIASGRSTKRLARKSSIESFQKLVRNLFSTGRQPKESLLEYDPSSVVGLAAQVFHVDIPVNNRMPTKAVGVGKHAGADAATDRTHPKTEEAMASISVISFSPYERYHLLLCELDDTMFVVDCGWPAEGISDTEETEEGKSRAERAESTGDPRDVVSTINWGRVDFILVSNHEQMTLLPYITEYTEFSGAVYATEPAKAYGRCVMEAGVEFAERGSAAQASNSRQYSQVEAAGAGSSSRHAQAGAAGRGRRTGLYSQQDIVAAMEKITD
ncbi:Integrator complex subunit 9, partial [Coemansia sp. RSA 1933]